MIKIGLNDWFNASMMKFIDTTTLLFQQHQQQRQRLLSNDNVASHRIVLLTLSPLAIFFIFDPITARLLINFTQ